MIHAIENDILRQISAEKAFEHIENIVKFGVRTAGSAAAQKTEAYFAKTCESYGLHAIVEDFTEKCYEPIQTKLTVTSPFSKEIECTAMMFGGITKAEGTEGELIFVGRGREEDFQGKDVKGKIVLFERNPDFSTDSFYSEVNLASKNGAIGAIMANYQPWPFNGTLESGLFKGEDRLLPIDPLIPAGCISSESGQFLKNALEKNALTVNLFVDAISGDRLTSNVRCLIPGTAFPNERIIICGHLDTEGNLGANDNASGLSIMLELARVLSEHPSKRTIELLAIGCEEVSSMGSLDYCRRHAADLKEIVCVLNIDMVGVGGDLHIITEGRWPDRLIPTPDWLYLFVKATAKELNYKVKFDICPLGTSDEGRFNDAGVPAVFFWKPGDEHYHSSLDVPEYVDPNNLKVVAEIAGLAAYRLANR